MREEQEEQLKEAMDLYGDYIVRLCYTYVRNWLTAEDLAQETFIKFYRAIPKFRQQSTVKTYLYRIAVNVCHDYLASWKHKRVVITNTIQKLLSAEKTTEQIVLQQTEDEALIEAIENLPPKYKDVIVLYHFIEMSQDEISETLNLPLNTVKTRLRRARQKLAFTLKEGEDFDGPH
ncbi:sigma-70 family RNA polymerase sigma factor [Ureibacillus acetophenoni]|uniref:RNA polymerase sigma-70 factor n=1 Tax=Ureibacillus acetophenoni TaxID=614649 RepID=A0A285UF70_9BACL|nr:sigma-70 family RNA polymerase sigma factor [Ureibacillus acetophenoni]SOC39226.1 RNA polymerase sigma-70 factor [Ureibacillus acetophenoni]